MFFRNQEPYQHLTGYEPVEGLNSPEEPAYSAPIENFEEDEHHNSNSLKEAAPSEFVT